ncbi:MAG TPA: hypothetical protein VNG51_18635 [Ktedonobacteraceae bacterium]|nr:hypothetical protein [Ktedonobacteraceae bacterium]
MNAPATRRVTGAFIACLHLILYLHLPPIPDTIKGTLVGSMWMLGPAFGSFTA